MSRLGPEMTVDRILRAVGEEGALKLLRAHGGRRLYVPQRARGTKLAKLLGEEQAEQLIEEFGTGDLLIPGANVTGQQARGQRIRKLLKKNTRSHAEIAALCEVSLRTVRRHASDLGLTRSGAGQDPRQGALPLPEPDN
ncbi:MAG: hypothetical protein AAFW69_11915 [Pseudomonadota bacterium]